MNGMAIGQLTIGAGDNYIVQKNGKRRNISEILNSMIFDHVDIKIASHGAATVEFEVVGLLIKDKVKSKTYEYFVGEDNLDKILQQSISKQIVFTWEVIKEDDGRRYEGHRN